MDWDALIENLILEKIKPHWRCCDVGSHEGRFSKLFASVCDTNGIVYSFDIDKNRPFINGCINERMAISDIDGVEQVYEGSHNLGNIIGHDVVYKKSISKGFIDSVRIDTYFNNIPLDCIKIDVEGAELKVIKGGINTFKKCSLIIIECHLEEDWEEIYDLLNDNGFVFYELSTKEKITRDFNIGPRGIMPYQIYCENN